MTRRKAIPDEMAARLWEAASRVLSSDTDLSVNTVSTETGIPRATVYYYFSGRADLAGFYADHLVDLAAEAAAKAAAEPGAVPERLRAALLAIYEPPLGAPVASATLLTVLGSSGDLIPQLISFRERGFDVIRDLLMDGIADGSLEVDDIDIALTTMFGALEMVALTQLGQSASIDLDSVAASVNILMRGVLAT